MATLRSALADYFAANGFPADGGYAATWVPLDFGPLRVYLYNSMARKRAVPIHDLHHLLTGYATTPSGEAEVAAWEFGAGTWPYWFATVINLPALGYGVVLWPGRMWAAFRRGRRMTSLYRQVPLDGEGGLEAWLDLELDDAQMRLPGAQRSAALDGVVFGCFVVAAFAALLLPLGALAWAIGSATA
jgi:hypothetical protein